MIVVVLPLMEAKVTVRPKSRFRRLTINELDRLLPLGDLHAIKGGGEIHSVRDWLFHQNGLGLSREAIQSLVSEAQGLAARASCQAVVVRTGIHPLAVLAEAPSELSPDGFFMRGKFLHYGRELGTPASDVIARWVAESLDNQSG